jgi:hypothetical protein
MSSAGEHSNFAVQAIAKPILLDFQVVAGLKVEPEALRSTKVAREPKRGVRGDGPLALHDFIDPARGHGHVFGETILAQAERAQKLLEENSARMDWLSFSPLGAHFIHGTRSVPTTPDTAASRDTVRRGPEARRRSACPHSPAA